MYIGLILVRACVRRGLTGMLTNYVRCCSFIWSVLWSVLKNLLGQRGRYKSDKPILQLPSKFVGGTLRTWLTLRSLCVHRTPCFLPNHRSGRSVAVCAHDAGAALALKSAVVIAIDKILDASTGQVRISACVSVTFHGQAEKGDVVALFDL